MKRLSAAAITMIAASFGHGGPARAVEGNLETFDLSTGILAVDYDAFLQKHDLVVRDRNQNLDPRSGTPSS